MADYVMSLKRPKDANAKQWALVLGYVKEECANVGLLVVADEEADEGKVWLALTATPQAFAVRLPSSTRSSLSGPFLPFPAGLTTAAASIVCLRVTLTFAVCSIMFHGHLSTTG